MPNLILDDMTWKNVRDNLSSIKLAIIPTGATEQHGPFLPMNVDAMLVSTISKRVGEILYPQALVSTTVPFGISYHHLRFQGSITVSESTLANIVYEIAMSLRLHGIRNFVMVNGHFANTSGLMMATRMLNDNKDVRCFAINYWDYIPESDKKLIEDNVIPGHATEFETSLMSFSNPKIVPKNLKRGYTPAFSMEEYLRWRVTNVKKLFDSTEDGITVGDPEKASEEKGRKLCEGISQEIAKLLKEEFEI